MKLIIGHHAKQRMIERIFSLDEVKEAVRDGVYYFDGVVSKKEERYKVVHKGISLIVIENPRKNTVTVKTVLYAKTLKRKLYKEQKATKAPISELMEAARNVTRKEIKKELKKKENRKRVFTI